MGSFQDFCFLFFILKVKFRAFYYIIYSVKAKFFFVIFLFSFACLFSDELKENIQKEKTVLTEAEKIVRSRKINKNSEDPPEIIPIDFVSQKLNEENDEIYYLYDEHPSIINFFNSLEDHGLDEIFSFNMNYMLQNFDKHVFGFQINYERQIFQFLSGKSEISLKTNNDSDLDINCFVFSLSLSSYVYPFNKGLEWLYMGFGFGFDFITYSGSNSLYNWINDAGFSIIPVVGWKQYVTKNFMFDFSIGYKFLFSRTENYDNNLKHMASGFQFSFGIKIMWNRILRNFIKNFVLIDLE